MAVQPSTQHCYKGSEVINWFAWSGALDAVAADRTDLALTAMNLTATAPLWFQAQLMKGRVGLRLRMGWYVNFSNERTLIRWLPGVGSRTIRCFEPTLTSLALLFLGL